MLVTLALCMTLAGSWAELSAPRATDTRPNIILIYADDMGYADLGCYGCKDIPTPHIDRLAADGVRFTDGYVSAPQCGPSRAGLLSGKYQNRFGYEYNTPQELWFTDGFPRSEKTMGALMKEQGYVTGLIGKWHMGVHPDLRPNQRGFDEFYGTLFGHSNFLPPYNYFFRRHRGRGLPASDIQRNDTPVNEREYLTDAFTREAVAFIERHQDAPFFLYLPYTAPHGPLQASRKYLNRFPGIKHGRRKVYAAMVSALDDGVGAIMAKVRECDLESNTLVFFISDNGATRRTSYGDNTPLRSWKGSLHEGGIRVPFIMSWPGTLPAGKVEERPVIQLDATATAVALAGGDVSDMDGVNLMPYLQGEKAGTPHEQLFWRIIHFLVPQPVGQPWQKAIRKGDWKLVLAESGTFELYNLRSDISESRDLAADHPERVKELEAAWNEWEATLAFPAFPEARFPWAELKAEYERSP